MRLLIEFQKVWSPPFRVRYGRGGLFCLFFTRAGCLCRGD
jgi:hypothetical protein